MSESQLAKFLRYADACKGMPDAEQDEDGEVSVRFTAPGGESLGFHFFPSGKILVTGINLPQAEFGFDLIEELRQAVELSPTPPTKGTTP